MFRAKKLVSGVVRLDLPYDSRVQHG